MRIALPHIERHFTASEAVRDVVIGMSDGLTVPFALAAGISGAIAQSHIVVTAGMAELAAGGIAMGLGGYLAARTDGEHYQNELRRERDEVERIPEHERGEVVEIFEGYGLQGEALERVVNAVTSDRERWIDFMMRFELGLQAPDPHRARSAAAIIGGSYVVGGIVPLLPYMLIARTSTAFAVSAAVTMVALAVFGIVKGRFTGVAPLKAGFQTLIIGGVAAAAAYAIAKLVS
ncbi:MAG: VIT1/CCC1 transporter family protein [Vulcanimicrobiaceae bacterium]